MPYIEELAKKIKHTTKEIFGEKYILIGEDYIYVENVARIISVLDCEIKLQLKKKILMIKGEKMSIKELGDKSLTVCGNINLLEFKNV